MIESTLIDYICSEIAYDRSERLTADALLLDGALDSTDVLRLVVFVEDHYHVRIEDGDLVPQNFASVNALADLLRNKGIS